MANTHLLDGLINLKSKLVELDAEIAKIIGLANGKTHCFNGGMKVRK